MENTKPKEPKNAYECGYAYARAMQGEDGFDEPYNISEHLNPEIPDDDAHWMSLRGIPLDTREYWDGYNAFVGGK